MSPQERAQYLPVMEALLRVMETSTPSPQDINELLIRSRDLTNQIPGGGAMQLFGQIGGFGIDDIEFMGLPETGDIIINVEGEPHIRTQFGK